MATLRAFLSGVLDYAALFPPAQLDMRSAVFNYSEYRRGLAHDLLGRFVLPSSRLAEFSDASPLSLSAAIIRCRGVSACSSMATLAKPARQSSSSTPPI